MAQIKLLEKHDTHFVFERNGERIVWPKDGFKGPLRLVGFRVSGPARLDGDIQTMLTNTEVGQVVEGWEF